MSYHVWTGFNVAGVDYCGLAGGKWKTAGGRGGSRVNGNSVPTYLLHDRAAQLLTVADRVITIIIIRGAAALNELRPNMGKLRL